MYSDNSNNQDFIQHTIIDQQQQGILAGTFEPPAGWQAGSNVFWNYQDSNAPVLFNAWAVNPNKFEMFAFLPMQSFSWTEPETGMYFRGQNVGGVINLPPMSPNDAVTNWMIPNFCANKENFTLIGIKAEQINRPTDPRVQSAIHHQISLKLNIRKTICRLKKNFNAFIRFHSFCRCRAFSE